MAGDELTNLNDPRAVILSDHMRLTFHYQGRDFRLTDTASKVIQGVLA